MSFSTSLGITTLRAVVVVLCAMPVCLWLKAVLQSLMQGRGLAWLLLLLPAMAPRMLTGFGFANFSLSLVPYPIWNECLYAVLLLISLVPIGTVLCYFAPPPLVSDQAYHCFVLAHTLRGKERLPSWSFLSRHWFRYAPAAGLMLLLAFQEFELASLMGVTSWSVWLFDAQAGGLQLATSLAYVLRPLLVELVVFGSLAWFVWCNAGIVTAPEATHVTASTTSRWLAWAYWGWAAIVFCLVPWSFVFQAALGGLPPLVQSFTVGSEIIAGGMSAFLATAIAYGWVWWWMGQVRRRHGGISRLVGVMLALPGLMGTLVLGLVLLFVFQSTPMYPVYDTPMPWLVGLLLFLMPRACMVALIVSVIRSPEAEHMAELLLRSRNHRHRSQARELRWRSHGALHYVAFGLLFFWAYSDLTLASILAPPGLVTAPVRLYNLMHYGQSAVLSAMVVVTFGVPVLVWSLVGVLRRPFQKVLMP